MYYYLVFYVYIYKASRECQSEGLAIGGSDNTTSGYTKSRMGRNPRGSRACQHQISIYRQCFAFVAIRGARGLGHVNVTAAYI